MVPAGVQLQTDDDVSAPGPTTCGELMECLEIVPGISPMPPESSRPGRCHKRLASMKPQLNKSISSIEPAGEHDMSPLHNAKPDEPVSVYPTI
jgi:hypothetical protein